MEKEAINVRFIEALNYLLDNKLVESKGSFALSLKISATKLSEILNSRMKAGTDLLARICDEYKISSDWLLTGKGPMIITEEKNHPLINQDFQGSPYYSVDFIGGFDLLMNDQTINPAFYINYPPYNKDGVVWVNLTGKSMEPELSNGDIIAIKPLNTPIQYLPTKEIYAIVTPEWRTVKRIELSDREGFIRLLPSNPEYQAQEIPMEMITKVYAVLGSIRKFF